MAKFIFQGIDYVRLTSPDQTRFYKWDDVMEHEFIREDRAGRKPHFRWVLGYYGRIGEHCFLGKNETGVMVQASGVLADELFRPLCRQGGKATRIDLQITSAPPDGPDHYLHAAYAMLCAREKTVGRPCRVEMNDSSYGCKMVTVGSRQSELYGRIYDKGQESKMKEWDGYVRHEVEIKERQADDMRHWLMEDITRVHTIKPIVGNFFERRGCPMYWDEYELKEMPKEEKRSRTDDTKLAWLATQVSKTVGELCAKGKEEEVARALLQSWCDDATIELVTAALKLSVHS